MRRLGSVALAAVLAVASAGIAQAAPTPQNRADARFDVYAGELDRAQLTELADLGLDRHELKLKPVPGKGTVRVEAILSGRQADQLRGKGVAMRAKRIDGMTAAERANALAADGLEVFRHYSGAGGLKEEFEQMAAANPRIAKLVTIGQTHQGQDIVALKITKNANQLADGKRPSVLYLGAQHAREWITPEMVRRLAHFYLDGYAAGDAQLRGIVDTTELWFLPVANPDGYDWSFEEDQRLWRKNLRDNNGDGVIDPDDGVDLNRNFAHKWGYDNEGSEPFPFSDTYRGPGPNSEPETQALDALMARVDFTFLVNYHSAAELLLYGVGWQVATPTPDDVIYEAMAGDDANPAVPGYDPDISAELYTTNGDTDSHAQALYGTLGFTPEMATCESASDESPDDEWEAEDCGSGFEFPDDEALVQAEFERNIPFALSVALSAHDPDDPVSVVGREAADFRADTFDVSYGDPQTVAVWAKRALKDVRMRYRVDGGSVQTTTVSEWTDGERYGDENNDYYGEFRGVVSGAAAGDAVEVWFTGVKPGEGPVQSEPFTYTVEQDTGADVLVIANEDYTGVNPTYPAGTNEPKYDEAYVAAVEAAGYSADVWDVDADGIPHDLGVLSHYDAIVWYLGDNRITQDPEDFVVESPFGNLPNAGVAERQQYLTMAVRDYLNDGGKLIHAGETAQHDGFPGISNVVGGLYYALNGDDTAECVISSVAGFFDDCLILANDFRQYWLGAFDRVAVNGPDSVTGIASPIEGYEAALGGGTNPLNEAGRFTPTSDVLPADEFPQFTSWAAALYETWTASEGTRYAGTRHLDDSYVRLTRTIDLAGVTAGQAPQLQFDLRYDVEEGYDHVIVEARTAGGDDWTTLPDLNGGTVTTAPEECEAGGFLFDLHPFLMTYLGEDCAETGSWNAFTGSNGGFEEVAFDLSAYAGKQVEISIAYVTDPATGGLGAAVDDTRLVAGGSTVFADGFEGATSGWAPGAVPADSPPTTRRWEFGAGVVGPVAGTATEDTLLLGFGLEQLTTDAERVALLEQALGELLP